MEKGAGSRLLQMQARFQQKQLQEREHKIASLYEAQQARALGKLRQSPIESSSASPPPQQSLVAQPGKVRQMFEERRTKAGIDKSYPLQPIHNTDRSRKPLQNGCTKPASSNRNNKITTNVVNKVTSNSDSLHKISSNSNVMNKISSNSSGLTKASSNRNDLNKISSNSHTSVTNGSVKTTSHRISEKKLTSNTINNVKKIHSKLDNADNSAGDLNHNHEPDLNAERRKQQNGRRNPQGDDLDGTYYLYNKDNEDMLENETFPDSLAPTETPRSPEPVKPPRRSPSTKISKESTKTRLAPVAPPRKVTSNTKVIRTSPLTQTSSTKARTVAPNAGSISDGVSCEVCGRRFAADRITKHQEICKRSRSKKRKPFDALKHRLAGTEAEPLIGKIRKQTNQSNQQSNTKVNKPMNSDWRKKHQEFIQAIRAAKQVQAHLNAGGKLSDLPPPPPSENPDYVQCPHCNRRFNQQAAERHIPKCATFQFNKPKPNAKKR